MKREDTGWQQRLHGMEVRMSHKKGSGNRKVKSTLFWEEGKLQTLIGKKSKWKSGVSMLLAVSLILSLLSNSPFALASQQKKEGEAHKHTFTCRELICQEEHEDGEHTKDCFQSSGPWKCGLSEGEIHVHDQDGYHCWIMAKSLTCSSTKSDADREEGMEEDENDILASGSDGTRSNAKTAKTRTGRHVHKSGCYTEVYECRPDNAAQMRLNPGETAEVSTWEELVEAFEAGCNVKLAGDIESSGTQLPLTVKSGMDITLDLNGSALTYSSGDSNLNFFKVEEEGTLTVDDTSSQLSDETLSYLDETDTEKEIYMCAGMIAGEGVDNVFSVEGTAAKKGVLNIRNGRITSTSSHRAVFSRGTVTMSGGYIIDNHNMASPALGGGVRLTGTGSFTMTGGFIANNSAEQGGGIYSIGAVSIGGDGVVCGNQADYGGAVCSPENSPVQIKGSACINGNTTNNSSKVIDGTNITITENGFVQGVVSDLEKLIANTASGQTLTLDKDYAVFSSIHIDKNITIELNGFTITYDGYNTDSQIFLVDGKNGSLTIQDAEGNGGIKSRINGLDRLIYVKSGGQFILKSGILENQNGLHGLLIEGSIMEMSGGTIENCGTVANGGGILMTSSSSLIMTGGTIIRNKGWNGGGIDMLNSTAEISGTAKIVKNEAVYAAGKVSGTGGGIRVRGSSKVTVLGNANISANLAGKKGGGIQAEGSSSAVASENAVISGNIAETGGAISGEGQGFDNGYIVEIKDNVKVIGNVSTGGGKVVVVNPETKLNSTVDLQEESQTNMLGQDIQAVFDQQGSILTLERSYIESSAITIDRELTIDLNGHIIIFDNSSQNGKLFDITETGKLVIQDQSGSSGTIISREGTPDSLIRVTGGQLELSGGTLKNINGSHGIWAEGGHITMTGGLIANCGTKSAEGGGLYLKGSIFHMSGGEITDNTGERGGGLYAADSKDIKITGGRISNNTAADSGGGFYLWNSIAEVGGLAEISDNTADIGGGISIYEKSNLVVKEKGSISRNTANGSSRRNPADDQQYDKYYGGGGIYANEDTAITLQGECTIKDNISKATSKIGRGSGGNGGGGIFSRGNVMMEGGMVSGNYAEDAGGGIYTAGILSKFTMTGGIIDGNTAHKDEGGGLRIDWKGTITAGQIINNRTETEFDWGGGGLFINTGATVEIQNLLVTENTADGFGGGVGGCSTGDIQLFSLKGAGIYDNHAKGTGLTQRGDGAAKADDRTIAESPIFYPVFLEGGFQDFYSAGSSIVYSQMLGGGDANWTGTYADSLGKVDGNKQFDLNRWGLVHIFGNSSKLATGWLALTAAPQAEDKQKAEGMATVLFSGNTSTTHGGGIMSNGTLKLGEGSRAGLAISKKANGFPDEEGKEFDFDIKLSHTVSLSGSYSYRKTYDNEETESGTMLFQEGKASFTLRSKESIEIFDLPVGTQYTVTENGASDYSTHITEQYQNIEEITNGEFTVSSQEDASKTDYEISFFDQDKTLLEGPYSYSQGGDEKMAGAGQTIISFCLNAGESIRLTPPAGAAYYKLSGRKTIENPADKSFEGIIHNNGESGKTEVSFENCKSGLVLKKINNVYGEEDKPFHLVLQLSSSNALSPQYQCKGEHAKIIKVTAGSNGAGSTKELEIELADEDSIEISGLPKDTKYTVKETGADEYVTAVSVKHTRFHSFQKGIAGAGGSFVLDPVSDGTEAAVKSILMLFTNPDGTGLEGSFPFKTQRGTTGYLQSGSMVSVHENETIAVTGLPEGTRYDCSLVMASQEGKELSGMVYGDSIIEVDVKNSKPGQLSLHGKKELKNGKLTAGSFSFELKADLNTPMPEGSSEQKGVLVKTVRNYSDGTFSFGNIVYTKEGIYHYQIEEVNEGKAGITYDQASYHVTVTVTKGEEGLHTEVAVEKLQEGKQPDPKEEVVFVNVKQPENPTDPKDPSDPDNPKDPSDPDNPKDPSDPDNPKDPSGPKDPTDPKDPTKPTAPTNPDTPDRPYPDSPGGGGGRNEDPTQPTQPSVPPSEPAQPGESIPPEEPAPEPVPSEEMETPILPELPDPNDPDSPDRVIIMEDGVPRAYKKVWDPETEEFLYIPEDEIPLAGKSLPRTGDFSGRNIWLMIWLWSLIGAGISWEARRRKRNHKDSSL